MSRRTLLVGMNNPLSREPEHALWPDPPGCTGWRIWKMTEARTGCTQEQYAETFSRTNLVLGGEWDRKQAYYNWVHTLESWALEHHDTIVLLGAAVREATRLTHLPSPYISRSLIILPHPSGLNRWYNSETNRQIVEVLMEELYVEALPGRGVGLV